MVVSKFCADPCVLFSNSFPVVTKKPYVNVNALSDVRKSKVHIFGDSLLY